MIRWSLMMNFEGCVLLRSCPILRYYTSICLEELRRITKDIIQDSWPLDRYSNPIISEYEAEVLITISWFRFRA
jgi:hypothetical protein